MGFLALFPTSRPSRGPIDSMRLAARRSQVINMLVLALSTTGRRRGSIHIVACQV